MKKKFFKKNKFTAGLSLAEVLIYISAFAILSLVIISFVFWANRLNAKTKAIEETLDSAKYALRLMTFEIKNSKSIYLPTTDTGQISLETTRYLSQGEQSSYIDFFLCDQALCLKKEGQAPIVLTSDKVIVKNLSFNVIGTDPASVQISIKVDYKNSAISSGYQASVDLNSTVSLRVN